MNKETKEKTIKVNSDDTILYSKFLGYLFSKKHEKLAPVIFKHSLIFSITLTEYQKSNTLQPVGRYITSTEIETEDIHVNIPELMKPRYISDNNPYQKIFCCAIPLRSAYVKQFSVPLLWPSGISNINEPQPYNIVTYRSLLTQDKKAELVYNFLPQESVCTRCVHHFDYMSGKCSFANDFCRNNILLVNTEVVARESKNEFKLQLQKIADWVESSKESLVDNQEIPEDLLDDEEYEKEEEEDELANVKLNF